MGKNKKMRVADNLEVIILPHERHEFLMTTAEAANGYGMSAATLRGHKHEHKDELIEGKHFVKGVGISNDPCLSGSYNDDNRIFWTKRGIVRLGFFIKSERAKMFRDWAEDLIIFTTEHAEKATQLNLFPEPAKRKHNRLTSERLVDILAEVSQVEDCNLRQSIVSKLLNY